MKINNYLPYLLLPASIENGHISMIHAESAVAQWCNPMNRHQELSGGVGSTLDRALSLERHDKGSRTQLRLAPSAIPVLGSSWFYRNVTFIFTKFNDQFLVRGGGG